MSDRGRLRAGIYRRSLPFLRIPLGTLSSFERRIMRSTRHAVTVSLPQEEEQKAPEDEAQAYHIVIKDANRESCTSESSPCIPSAAAYNRWFPAANLYSMDGIEPPLRVVDEDDSSSHRLWSVPCNL